MIERPPPQTWNASAYNVWLSALSKLDDVPAGTHFPEVMRGRAWQAKQLQTQLASWAELRHDTVLYAKQSYSVGVVCEYPTGYVEPYPELYARLAVLVGQVKRALPGSAGAAAFLDRFAVTMRRLERLARKELAAEAFDDAERTFLKDTISVGWRGGARAPETIYSGWYAGLFYDGNPDVWAPTVADVHTDPEGRQALEVAVGDANFLVVAIDNDGDRAAYVGPIYSYYEFSSAERLTDEQWQARLRKGHLPDRPPWIRAFQAPPMRRDPILPRVEELGGEGR